MNIATYLNFYSVLGVFHSLGCHKVFSQRPLFPSSAIRLLSKLYGTCGKDGDRAQK